MFTEDEVQALDPLENRGDLLTLQEAADELGIPANRIKQWIHRGLPRASRRPLLLWSRDVYEWEGRLGKAEARDRRGRFVRRAAIVV